MNNYCVYSHTNIINGKKYIGITSQVPHRRWNNGKGYINNKYFYRAILKYGWHNFQHDILYTDLCKEEAEQIEIALISEYRTTNPECGYNIEAGGNGTEKFTEEIKLKISQALQGHPCSDETKEKIRQSKIGKPSGRKGIKLTPEQVNKNRISHLGQTPWNKGRPLSDEERAKCNGKPVICIESGIIYRTAHEAARDNNVDFSSICKCCNGKIKTYKGFHWKWSLPKED